MDQFQIIKEKIKKLIQLRNVSCEIVSEVRM